MKHRCRFFRRHILSVTLIDVAEIDRTEATFTYREYCTRCGWIRREWEQTVSGLSTNGTGWTLARFREFTEDLLRIRPLERIWS